MRTFSIVTASANACGVLLFPNPISDDRPNTLLAVRLAALAMASLCLPTVSAQLAEMREEESLQLVINYGGEEERRLSTHEGVIESFGLVYDQLQPVTLLCSEDKAGQSVTLSPLDGDVEITVEGNATAIDSRAAALSVGHDGTANFVLKGPLPGSYRILVTIGVDQYELQFHARKIAPDTVPLSTPPPN